MDGPARSSTVTLLMTSDPLALKPACSSTAVQLSDSGWPVTLMAVYCARRRERYARACPSP